jgi:hypothetical protein
VFAQAQDWKLFTRPRTSQWRSRSRSENFSSTSSGATEAQSNTLNSLTRGRVEQELADAFIYLMRLSYVLDVDLIEAAFETLDVTCKETTEMM